MDETFGDFEEIKEEENNNIQQEQEEGVDAPVRVRMPRKGEILGIVIQRLGGNRMEVKTIDGKSRNCRVPGRFRRKFWLRQGDVVIITPWETDDDKGDIIFQYSKGAAYQIKKRGLLDSIDLGF